MSHPMSEADRPSLPPIPPSRKRKRNLSAASIDDIIPALQDEQAAEPSSTLIAPQPRPARPVTPPLVSDSSPLSTAGTSATPPRATSPIFERVSSSESILPGSQSPRSAVVRRLSRLTLERSDSESSLDITPRNISSEPSSLPESAGSTSATNHKASKIQEHKQDSRPPKKRLPPPRGIKSPPPKGLKPPPSKPAPSSEPTADSWLDLTALTWQDSEITGHLMLDPDDDGYGVNGIGFKPTPAMALARSRRRKQQVSAWRTREEREERERRAEKRRQGKLPMYGDGAGFGGPLPTLQLPNVESTFGKKVVRFDA